jgi:hypothetical protein
MQKLLKCAGNNDVITLKAEDSAEMLTLMYEDPKADRVSGEHRPLLCSQLASQPGYVTYMRSSYFQEACT